MMKEALREREKALENEFFDKQNKALLERLRASRQREEERKALAAACGVDDETLLDRLIDLGVGPESLAALVLVPYIAVAWADREMAATERRAVLDEAAEFGIDRGSAAHELLDAWLQVRPPRALFEAWRDYVGLLCRALDPYSRADFARQVLRRARQISHEAGGVLGVIGRTSSEEKAVLERLELAFAVD